MKIFLVGTEFFNYTNALKGAFEVLGHTVKCGCLRDEWSSTFAGKLYKIGWNAYKKIIRKPDELYRQTNFIRKRESDKILKMYQDFQPDVVVVFAAYMLTREALVQMNSCKKILWIFDSINNLSKIYATLPEYDMIYTFEGSDIDFFMRNGYKAEFLPLCADEKTYYKQSKEKEIDIFFVGHMSKDRVHFFRKLHAALPNVQMRIYGRYIGKYNLLGKYLRKKNKEDEYLLNQFLKPQEINDFYARSKICLNVHHNQTRYGANARVFETLAAGAFQLVNENEYIVENFKDGLVTYRDNNDLIEKIKYYLKNEEEREEISKKGYEKVVNEDLFIHRARYILSKLEENKTDLRNESDIDAKD